jgi:hypothetical protein
VTQSKRLFLLVRQLIDYMTSNRETRGSSWGWRITDNQTVTRLMKQEIVDQLPISTDRLGTNAWWIGL